MLESSKEYKGEFSVQINQKDIQNNLRGLLNHHVQIQFPGLERGLFPEVRKQSLFFMSIDNTEKAEDVMPEKKPDQSVEEVKDPLSSLHKED